jgi:hypothetical protein
MRAISLPVHGALEMLAAPAIMAAPFVLGFSPAATVVTVLIGTLLLGLSLQADGPGRAVPPSAHAGFDLSLATIGLAAGLAIGLAQGEWIAGAFLVGIGVAQVALTAVTRFTVARGA